MERENMQTTQKSFFFLSRTKNWRGTKEHLQKSVFLSHYGMEISLTLSCSTVVSVRRLNQSHERKQTHKKRASQPVWTSQSEESPTSSILVSFQWGNVLSAKRTGPNIQLLQAVKKKSPMESLAHIKWSHRQVTEWLHKMSPSGDGSATPQEKKKKKTNITKSCQWCSEKSHRTSQLQSVFFFFFCRQL